MCTLEALHRGVDILRFERKGKKPSFEVAGDLAAMRKRYRGSNEDLEAELRAEAKLAKTGGSSTARCTPRVARPEGQEMQSIDAYRTRRPVMNDTKARW